MFKKTISVGTIRQRINGVNVVPSLGVLKSLGCVSLLSILAACGGSGSGSVTPAPAADTQAPTIAFSASQTNPEGGETITLSAVVTDNRDSGLTANLSCDGGSLSGEVLTLPSTDIDMIINCTAAVSDAAGNSTSESLLINVTPSPDMQAPSIAFSASKMNLEGGETVILSAKVTDNRDSGLSADITCDSGDLREEFLQVPVPDTETIITCDATAVDAAGNTGEATLSITVAPSVKNIEFSEGKTSFVQGEVGVLFLENFELEATQYSGTLGDESVTLINQLGQALTLAVPLDLEVGEHLLTVNMDDSLYSFPILIEAAVEPSDPQRSITEFLEAEIEGIEYVLTQTDLEMDEISALEARRASIEDFIDDLPSKPAEDVMNVAKIIAANFDPSLNDNSASSNKTLNRYDNKNTPTNCKTIFDQSALGITKDIALLFGNLGMYAFTSFDEFFGEIVGNNNDETLDRNKLSSQYFSKMERFLIGTEEIYVACRYRKRSSLEGVRGKPQHPDYVQGKALFKTDEGVFTDGEPYGFELIGEYELFEEVATDFSLLIERLLGVAENFDYFPDSLLASATELTQTTTEIIQDNVFLGEVSPSNISGQLTYGAGSGTLNFDYNADDRNPLGDGVEFTYELNDGTETYGTFSGVLSDEPKAENAQITVGNDKTTQFDVLANGESLRIVTEPTLGTVSAIDGQTFAFTPIVDAVGDDSFEFVSVLGSIESDPATVFLKVVPPLPTADGYTMTTSSGEEIEGPILSENAESIRITRFPGKGTVSVNGTETFVYTANDDAGGNDSFDFVAENFAGVSDPATMNVTIKSGDLKISNVSYEIERERVECCEYFYITFDFESYSNPLSHDYTNESELPSRCGGKGSYLEVTRQLFFPANEPCTSGIGYSAHVNHFGGWRLLTDDNGRTGSIKLGMSVHTGYKAGADTEQERLDISFVFRPRVDEDGNRLESEEYEISIPLSSNE